MISFLQKRVGSCICRGEAIALDDLRTEQYVRIRFVDLITERIGTFWLFQNGGWAAYGIILALKYYQAVEAERRRVLAAESAAREAELRALRCQIHPHFLFNTLKAISTLVIEGHTEAATAMITRLAGHI